MSRVFPSQNEKREIRISIGNKNSRSKISVPTAKCERKIIFKKKSAKKSHSSQKWKDELLKFIAESKKQIDVKARNAIEMVEKWQLDTCARFDIIQQHISKASREVTPSPSSPKIILDHVASNMNGMSEIDSEITDSIKNTRIVNRSPNNHTPKQNASINCEIVNYDQPTEQPKKVEKPKSMPILFDDSEDEANLNAFLKRPYVGTPDVEFGPRKAKNRRKTNDFTSSEDMSDVPIRKKSFTVHSSVLAAVSTNSPKVVLNRVNEQSKSTVNENSPKPLESTPLSNNDNTKKSIKKTSSNEKKSVSSAHVKDPVKLSLYQKFLETKKLVIEREKRAQEAAKIANVENDGNTNHAYPMPILEI